MANMTEEDLIHAVNKIHADAGLKSRVMTGESAPRTRKPLWQPLLKSAACLAALAVVGLTVLAVPRVLKPVTSVPQSGNTAVSNSFSQPGIVNGLYHDDAVQNILLLGVDEHDKDDAGRSDCMLLVSIDRRHNKLKLTSFLRDMYVAIPGHEKNRLGSAYSFGKAPLTVQTIESNFGIDIDHYFTIESSAFPKMIDNLGGVSISLTNEEAKLINRYSDESSTKSLTAGTCLLTGKQALYYSRIRAVGTDFGRTERQRKVVAGIANKLKSFNIGAINSMMNEVLPLVTTNMDKNAVIQLASDSLTYMNYPISQTRLPEDSTYQEKIVTINSYTNNAVLLPDVQTNKQNLEKFIYEDEFPVLTTESNSSTNNK